MAQRRKATATSSFGVSRREGHDSSGFYSRFRSPAISNDSRVSPEKAIDEIFCSDARSMHEVADLSVALVVTSPPYFAGKEYEEALGQGSVPATYIEYLRMLEEVFVECERKLEPGGRIAVNVANLGRKPYRSLSADVISILQDGLGLLLRGEIVWQKARGSAGSCAWGSFRRPANPVLRDLTERVVVASKSRFDRALSPADRKEKGLPHEPSLTADEFMEATTDIWEIPSESATRVGHPAPFPVELPERLIHLYTYRGDLVLDPFAGAGSTAVAAVRTGRHFAGYDMEPAYVELARTRISEARAGVGRPGAPGTPPSGPEAAAGPADGGASAQDVAQTALEAAGFRSIKKGARAPGGIDVSYSAIRHDGTPLFFEVTGGFTAIRPGLNRSDALWKALGKAAAVSGAAGSAAELILLAPALPPGRSAAAAALQSALAPAGPVRAVIDLSCPDCIAELAAIASG